MGSMGHFESCVESYLQALIRNDPKELYKILTGSDQTGSRIISTNIKNKLPDEYHNKILSICLVKELSFSEKYYLDKFM
jgi:hypothetical protein